MFHIASPEEIKKGLTTDIYFLRVKKILEEKNISKRVVAEISAKTLPKNYRWAIFAGLEEALKLLEGLNVNVYAIPEGTIFYPEEPVFIIEGDYKDFCIYETAILGFLCQASGIATKAARLKKLAGDKKILSFGVRRMHPAIAPMIDRAAYIGGADGFSCFLAEKFIGEKAVGTMPHAFILILGDQILAWKYFDEVIEKEVPRIALVDTFYDEKIEAVMAAEKLNNLYGVRLDTPSSRRGNLKKIVEEVRWELNIRGYDNVKIFVSGGIDEEDVKQLRDIVDGFGIGTAISNAETIDFSMDIVEVENKPIAKRGKKSGRKTIYRCEKCMRDIVIYYKYKKEDNVCERCGEKYKEILTCYIKDGKLVRKLPSTKEIRRYVLNQLDRVEI